jgi:3-mercaptopyruvate sulfurtransferase SseA
MGNYRETSLVSVVICDEKGKIYEEIERHVQAAGIANVLYLEGGLEGYKAFEQQQISMQQEKKVRTGKTVKTNKNCTACP